MQTMDMCPVVQLAQLCWCNRQPHQKQLRRRKGSPGLHSSPQSITERSQAGNFSSRNPEGRPLALPQSIPYKDSLKHRDLEQEPRRMLPAAWQTGLFISSQLSSTVQERCLGNGAARLNPPPPINNQVNPTTTDMFSDQSGPGNSSIKSLYRNISSCQFDNYHSCSPVTLYRPKRLGPDLVHKLQFGRS